jgi:DNA-directed RNA polymerase specialized sigma24 family protein
LVVNEAETWELAEQVMTKEQHLAFWLRHHEDFTVTQISRMLGISRQAVDARIEGGRRRLQQALKAKEAA